MATIKPFAALRPAPELASQICELPYDVMSSAEARHIEALNAQTGPVFLVYRASKNIEELVTRSTAEPPSIDFVAADGVRHTAWVIADAQNIHAIESEFTRVPALYIADGHHRSAAA